MATLNITVELGAVTTAQLVDYICLEYGYQAILPMVGPNPETKSQFAKRMLVEWYMGIVNRQRKSAEQRTLETNFVKTIFT